MANKKTSVVLPSGITGLVQQVQHGGVEPKRKDRVENEAQVETEEPAKEPATEDIQAAENESATKKGNVREEERYDDAKAQNVERPVRRRRGRPANPKQDVTATEKASRQYKILKDSGDDSWDLFLALGKIYKTRDDKLATIYIDPDLKRILDRLKTSYEVKLPTSAILSSIVARFIFDHEKKINDVIFGERLI